MYKKLLAAVLAVLLLTGCSSGDRGAKELSPGDQLHEILNPEKNNDKFDKTDFAQVDTQGRYGLYYYDYTQDYHFDEFLEDGGADSQRRLVLNAMDYFPDIELDLQSMGYGCSSYYAQGKDGDYVMGRNFDMSSTTTGNYLVLHTHPKDGYESYSTVNLKFLGLTDPPVKPEDGTSPLLLAPYAALDGINSQGVAICVLQLNTKPIAYEGQGDIDHTPTTLIRHVLDRAKNLEEALQIMESSGLYTEGYAYHFMVADASGHGAVVEYVDDEITVVYLEDDPALICANTYVSRQGRRAYSVRDGNESDKRCEKIADALEELDYDLDTDGAMEALSAAWVSTTRWSIVFDLTDRSMVITVNRDKENRYTFRA